MRRRCHQFIAIAAWVLSSAASAAVNDIYPTDFIALSNGSLNITVYAGHQKSSGPYTNGVRSTGEINIYHLVLRASRIFSVGQNDQYAWAPVLVLGSADVNGNAALNNPIFGGGASGMGDLRLGNAFWFHIDRPNRTYGLIGLFAILPTGDYDRSRILNVGENRMRYVLTAGWMQPIGGKWLMEVSPEIAVYGDNDQYLGDKVRSQENSYALTTYLRYRQTDALQFYGGAQINRGGVSQVSGANPGGGPDNTRLYLGTLLFTSPKSQWQLRFSKDVKIENGFRSDGELSLRYLMSFN